ncbi:LysE family translocator [Undibacterium sp. SXout20W]|uniref:LysE family translocator n=1 Tax=Undibacterium sp. SXout20W TaxID=3413051 RepID=UPI003BEF74DB
MKLHTWWLFVTATFFISAAPGPNMLLIMSQSVRFNFRSAMCGAMGCLTALFLMMSASAAGLGVLLRSAPAVFETLRWAGALYLAYLGYKLWTAPVSDTTGYQTAPAHKSPPAAWDLYRVGFVTAASNPKALLFAAAFLPQFIQAGSPQLPQFGILLSSFAVIEMSWYLIYALGGFKLSTYLKKASVLKMFNRITGGAFVGFAALMAGMKA